LEQYGDVRVDRPSSPENPMSLAELLHFTSDLLLELKDNWMDIINRMNMSLDRFPVLPGAGSEVPTASPRELLITLLLNHSSMREKIGKEGLKPFIGRSILQYTLSF
jgi:hypothetical protein